MDLNQPSLPLSMRIAPYKNYIYLALLCLVLAFSFAMKMGKRKLRTEADFVVAMNSFSKWEEVLGQEHDELQKLVLQMKKHPELKTQYEGALAQRFIAVQAQSEAKKYGKRIIRRTKQPYYSDFAKGSLLITEGKLEEALAQALKLKKMLLSDSSFWEKRNKLKSFGSGLFAFNLMRIATLYHGLNDKGNEIEAWNELKAYAGWDGKPRKDERINPEGFQALLAHFTVQDISLLDYMHQELVK